MQEDILTHLKQKYQPDAIILHGSRARGLARKHSDWDFIFLYEKENKNVVSGRELFKSQNIEFVSIVLPVEDILEVLGTKLQAAIVLHEDNHQGTELLEEARKIYSAGLFWSEQKISGHKLWIQGRIDGMRDNVERPILFYKYYSDFYPRVFSYWYWIKQESYSQPIYVALTDIKSEDPDYFNLIEQLISAASLVDKIEVTEKIRDYLFK
jgi:predicted nucleotidyltransferase